MNEDTVSEQITKVRITMAELGVKLDNLTGIAIKLDSVSKVADAAIDSASSAHKRINDMVVTQRWLLGLALSATGMTIALAGLIFNILK